MILPRYHCESLLVLDTEARDVTGVSTAAVFPGEAATLTGVAGPWFAKWAGHGERSRFQLLSSYCRQRFGPTNVRGFQVLLVVRISLSALF